MEEFHVKFLEKLSSLEKTVAVIESRTNDIYTQTTKTNGRVSILEAENDILKQDLARVREREQTWIDERKEKSKRDGIRKEDLLRWVWRGATWLIIAFVLMVLQKFGILDLSVSVVSDPIYKEIKNISQ